jgi:hypothetical protein
LLYSIERERSQESLLIIIQYQHARGFERLLKDSKKNINLLDTELSRLEKEEKEQKKKKRV